MSGSINFSDYLLRNEKWLGSGNEAKGNHATDGTLDDNEISVFFSGSHIEIGSSSAGDAILTEAEFNKWYNSNKSAISAYYNDIGVELNDSSKKSMLQSMLDFISGHSNTVAKEQKTTANPNGTKLGDLDVSGLKGTQNQPQPTKTGISDADAKIYADQLYNATEGRWGTDDEQVANIMNDKNLTNADWLKIMEVYNNQHGSLVNAIDGDFSGSTKKKYLEKLAGILVAEAEKDTQNAVKLLCKEFYNGTAGKLGTADEFIDHIFNKASKKVLGKLARQYGTFNSGRDIFQDIKGDFSGSTEDKYIRMLNEAISATGGSAS